MHQCLSTILWDVSSESFTPSGLEDISVVNKQSLQLQVGNAPKEVVYKWKNTSIWKNYEVGFALIAK